MDQGGYLQAKYKVSLLIWIAMIGALFFYGVIAQLSFSYAQARTVNDNGLLFILLIVSVLELMAGNWIKSFILKQTDKSEQGPVEKTRVDRLFVATLASLACSEAVALYGLVLSILSGNILHYAFFAFLAFGGLFFYRPQILFWQKYVETSSSGI